MIQLNARIVSNKKTGENYFRCLLEAPRIAKEALPGQFVNIKITDTDIPLLRRPLSIHRVSAKNIEVLYEVVGEGTRLLSKCKVGESLDIIGPLGNGFTYGTRNTDDERRILVAGGMGVAPLMFLAEKLRTTDDGIRATVLIGAKTKRQIICEKEFKDLGCSVKIATDDGSRGFKGRVTELLKSILRDTDDGRRTTIYACGPRPMLKEISRISIEHSIPAQISLEEHMACGIGACLGCVIQTRDGFQRVCKEGPVFEAGQIIL